MRRAIWWGAAATLTVGVLTPAMARPGYLAAFKTHYKTTQAKPALNAANCGMCHMGMPREAKWNAYGEAVRTALGGTKMAPEARIIQALQAAEKMTNATTKQTYAVMIAADKLPASAMAAPGGAAPGGAPPRPGGAVAPRPGGAAAGPAAVTGTWQALFNGVNMDGWTKMNAGNWVVENGILKYTGGGNGWLRSNQQYTNYALVVVWRYPQASPANDAGIFLKAGMTGNPWPMSPQLNMGPMQNFGSIGGTQGTRPRYDLIKPTDWNTYQVTVQNGMATLAINNQIAWDQATGIATGPGYLGFQAEGRPLEIAQIWVMNLQ